MSLRTITRALAIAATVAAVVGVLFAVLRSARERQVGIALALPALVSNVAHYALHERLITFAAAVCTRREKAPTGSASIERANLLSLSDYRAAQELRDRGLLLLGGDGERGLAAVVGR